MIAALTKLASVEQNRLILMENTAQKYDYTAKIIIP